MCKLCVLSATLTGGATGHVDMFAATHIPLTAMATIQAIIAMDRPYPSDLDQDLVSEATALEATASAAMASEVMASEVMGSEVMGSEVTDSVAATVSGATIK